MATYRAILVDDEPLARDYLRSLLRGVDDFEVIAEAGDGPTALRLLREIVADVVFLDVQMPGMSGVEVLEQLGDMPVPTVVFVTAFDEYAIKAFDHHAVDYLLKPFDEKRFLIMVERLRERLTGRSRQADSVEPGLTDLIVDLKGNLAGAAESYVSRIPVRVQEKVLLIKAEAIDWIEASDYYATIHSGGKGYLLRESLKNLEQQLDPKHFVRVHRNAIVNIDRIAELQAIGGGEYQIVAGDGSTLRLSRRRKDALEKALGRSL